jgi:putative heme iron utilization protein
MKQTPDFDPVVATKKLLREAREGALATLMVGDGHPDSALIDVATAADGSPLLLISNFAAHRRNIDADPRVSIMLKENKKGDPLAGGRIILKGTAVITQDPEDKRRYHIRNPGSEQFASFSDFAFYKVNLTKIHYVFGFGRIGNLKPEQVLTRVDDAARLVEAEAEIVAHLNEDHAEACRLYATKLLKGRGKHWRCVGCDPEGIELQNRGRTALRLAFTERMLTPMGLRKALIAFGEKARAV